MGVRGLTTFIKNNEKKYLKNHKLHNCRVVLDGNSIASNLYIWSNLESAFGGDYDKFAKYVKEFFKLLQKCDISPIVVFDGGYEQRKLKTVYQRMKDKFASARSVQPYSGSINFPLFMRIVFREVLLELNIPFCQSDFEADDELAALARQLTCPVISYDSDFYIYDVLYIPFTTVNLQPIAFKDDAEAKDASTQYFLECKIYNVEDFIQSFGGLDKSMLPILAALLGNDYIKRSVFKAFYTNLKIPKGKTNHLQRRIQAVIQWLRNETFESAIRKILGRMKKQARRRVARQIQKIINGYIQCSSVVGEYLGINPDEHSVDTSKLIQVDTNVLTFIEQNDKELLIEENEGDLSSEKSDCSPDGNQVDSNSENSDGECSSNHETTPEKRDCSPEVENQVDSNSENSDGESSSNHKKTPEKSDCSPEVGNQVDSNSENSDGESISNHEITDIVCEEEDDTGFPDWLLLNARKGKIQSCVVDILCLNQYFFPPQVEDYSQSPSHNSSLKILSALVGLLIGQSDGLVKYWTRRGTRLDWYTVEPIFQTASVPFPTLDNLPGLEEHQRLSILLEVADVSVCLQQFPEEWHLFVVAVLFWLKNMKEPVPSESHLHTLIMCLVTIYTIDFNIGLHRNKQTFMRKYKNYLGKLTKARSQEKEMAKETKNHIEKTINESLDPKSALSQVTRDDCISIFESILPYHHLSEQLKVKPKLFCLTSVHAFAQFQSCLLHLLILNSVLNFPLKETTVNKLFSGTFVYNMFANLSKRNNITAYVETFFQQSPTLLNLYKSLVQAFYSVLGEDSLHRKPTKINKKKKKISKLAEEEEYEFNVEKCADDNEFFCENNIFSKLSLEA